MIDERYNRQMDATAGDFIRMCPLFIEDDHHSLPHLADGAAAFSCEGEEWFEFVRRCLRSLLDAGAVPAVAVEGWPSYERTDRWGTEPDEIIEAMIADFLARDPNVKLDWGDYALTFPENCDEADVDVWGLKYDARRAALAHLAG